MNGKKGSCQRGRKQCIEHEEDCSALLWQCVRRYSFKYYFNGSNGYPAGAVGLETDDRWCSMHSDTFTHNDGLLCQVKEMLQKGNSKHKHLLFFIKKWATPMTLVPESLTGTSKGKQISKTYSPGGGSRRGQALFAFFLGSGIKTVQNFLAAPAI